MGGAHAGGTERVIDHLVMVGVGAALGAAATWGTRGFARARGIVNQPNPIVPQHREPVAYLGGLAFTLAAGITLVVAALTGAGAGMHARILLPALVFLTLGTWDDLHPLSPRTKILLQVAGAAMAVALGVQWNVSGVTAIDAALSMFWIVLVVNAFNLTDVCDGLLTGLTVIAFAWAGVVHGDAVAWPLIGAALGFLVFNFPNASIFLGDGGSHLLGFLAAALVIPSGGAVSLDLGLAALVLAVPLFELIFLIVVRARKGIPFWLGSPDHFSLRLQQGGASKRQTDLIAWSVAGAFALLAAFLPAFSHLERWLVLAAVVVFCAAAVRILLRWEVRRS